MIQTELPFPADGESNSDLGDAHEHVAGVGIKDALFWQQKEGKAHSVQLEVLYLKLVKQKMSFLAPLNISRLQFSGVHSLKKAWLTPSLKNSSPFWLSP